MRKTLEMELKGAEKVAQQLGAVADKLLDVENRAKSLNDRMQRAQEKMQRSLDKTMVSGKTMQWHDAVADSSQRVVDLQRQSDNLSRRRNQMQQQMNGLLKQQAHFDLGRTQAWTQPLDPNKTGAYPKGFDPNATLHMPAWQRPHGGFVDPNKTQAMMPWQDPRRHWLIQQQKQARMNSLVNGLPGRAGGLVREGIEIAKWMLKLPGPLKVAAIAAAGFAASLVTAKRTLEFASLQSMTGGTGAETGRLRGMFGAIGLNDHQGGVAAGRMIEHMMTDPRAMMWSSRLGVRFTPGPYGDPNMAEKLIKVIDRLGNLQGAQKTQAAFALAGGRNETFDYIMRYSMLDKMVKDQIGVSGKLDSFTYTPKRQGESANFMARLDLLWKSLQRLTDEILQPLIPVFNALLQGAIWLVDGFTLLIKGIKWVLAHLDPMHHLKETFGIGPGSMWDDGHSATRDNTDAIKKNTLELNKMQRELFGTGQFANTAIPAGFSGPFLNKNLEHYSLGIGAL